MHPDALVRVWTYQGDDAWNIAQARGYFSGSSHHIENEDHFAPAPYAWMREQMKKRLPDYSGDYPVWAWMKRLSAKKWPQKYMGTQERHRITALIPRKRILISNYETWHSVLNNGLLCDTEAEYDAFEAEWGFHPSTQSAEYSRAYAAAVEPSWEKIFSFCSPSDQTKDMIYWNGSAKKYILQACVDRIYLNEITNYRDMAV